MIYLLMSPARQTNCIF